MTTFINLQFINLLSFCNAHVYLHKWILSEQSSATAVNRTVNVTNMCPTTKFKGSSL